MQVVIQKIPENLQEFETLAAKGRQPEHICALFLCALALFDRDKDAGTAAMDILRGPRPMTPYDCQFLRDRLRGKTYLPLAYFANNLLTWKSKDLYVDPETPADGLCTFEMPALRTYTFGIELSF